MEKDKKNQSVTTGQPGKTTDQKDTQKMSGNKDEQKALSPDKGKR